MSSKSKTIPVSYNAPVTLTLCLISFLILILDIFVMKKTGKPDLATSFFSCPGAAKSPVFFDFKNPVHYVRLVCHVFGHTDFSHFIANFSFILLLGPLLEERYGSFILGLMCTITAIVTGVINACFIPTILLGSSGIAFMMIVLSSFASIKKGQIPLSFILIFIIYIGKEFMSTKSPDANIATFAHIAGGLCGSMFGFLVAPKTSRKKDEEKTKEVRLEEIDAASPRNRKPGLLEKLKKRRTENEMEEIGTINI